MTPMPDISRSDLVVIAGARRVGWGLVRRFARVRLADGLAASGSATRLLLPGFAALRSGAGGCRELPARGVDVAPAARPHRRMDAGRKHAFLEGEHALVAGTPEVRAFPLV